MSTGIKEVESSKLTCALGIIVCVKEKKSGLILLLVCSSKKKFYAISREGTLSISIKNSEIPR